MSDLGKRLDGTTLTEPDLYAALRKMREHTGDNAHTLAVRVLVADVLAHPEMASAIDEIQVAQTARRRLTEEEEMRRRNIRIAALTLVLGLFGIDVHDRIGRCL